jgi:dihydrofolate reductase
MARLKMSIAMSLDGYVAGPDPTLEEPLGKGGEQLHQWAFELAAWREPHGLEGGEVNASTEVVENTLANVGATVMGRNMFGGSGPWEGQQWDGWWGDDPPFHHPVFVLTHHPRRPLELQGGTTFHFVTDGVESALRQAVDAAGGRDVILGGGAQVAQEYLTAGLRDELRISLVPVLLGGGRRLLDGIDPAVRLERVGVVDAPGVTHLTYRPSR